MRDFFSVNIIIEWDFAFGSELNNTAFEREKGMVFAHAYISARQNLRTALAHDNLASQNTLTVVYFDAKIFGIGITTVFSWTCRFLMSHGIG